MEKNILINIEFEQFISRIKSDKDAIKNYIDDDFRVAILISYIWRFFYICNDNQFNVVREYLLSLFSKPFLTGNDLYKMKVSQEILDIIYSTFSEAKKDAALNVFGKGRFLPFAEAPTIVFGDNAYEENSKPFCVYKFNVAIKNNKLYQKMKLPIFMNPSDLFVPLSLGFIIEYIFLTINNHDVIKLSKEVVLNFLKSFNTRKLLSPNLLNSVWQNYCSQKRKEIVFDEEDKKYMDYIIANSSGSMNQDDARDIIRVLFYNHEYGKAEALKEFDIIANKLLEKSSLDAIFKISFMSGLLYPNGILTKEESDELGKKYTASFMENELPHLNEVSRLKDSLDSGVITQEEFEAKKKELLGK